VNTRFGAGIVLAVLVTSACQASPADEAETTPPTPRESFQSESLVLSYQPELIESMIRAEPEFADWSELYGNIRLINDMASLGPGIPLEAELSPTVNPEKAQETIEAYSQAMGLWSFFGVESVPAVWSLMSENDYDWWYQRVQDIEGENPALDVWDPVTNQLGHCYPNSTSFCGYGNPQASSGITFQYNVIGSAYRGEPNPNTVAHEAVHFYQDSFSQEYYAFTPCWFVEGHATLIGNAISGTSSSGTVGDGLSRFGSPFPGDGSWEEEQWLELLDDYTTNDEAKRDCTEREYNYTLGAAIFEYLYLTYSMWTIHELTLAVSESEDWSASVEGVLGVTVDELNASLAQYVTGAVSP
jgi:hypothetical protein